MIKKIIRLIGLLVFITISFFYTDKVINVIKEDDEIMIKINNNKSNYEYSSINATISANTIIPGISGRSINIEESYKNMKAYGLYNKDLFIYNIIKPDISIEDNKDKYIIKGNNNKQIVSLIFILNNNRLIDEYNKILKNNKVTANFFVDYNYLIDNSTKIKELNNHEFYSYGNNGIYTSEKLLFSNNLISRISNNNAIYCLTQDMNKEVLNICSKNNLYTIVPNIISDNNNYLTVKNNLTNGSIILLNMNNDTLNQLNTIIEYIKGKGYDIKKLSILLNE